MLVLFILLFILMTIIFMGYMFYIILKWAKENSDYKTCPRLTYKEFKEICGDKGKLHRNGPIIYEWEIDNDGQIVYGKQGICFVSFIDRELAQRYIKKEKIKEEKRLQEENKKKMLKDAAQHF